MKNLIVFVLLIVSVSIIYNIFLSGHSSQKTGIEYLKKMGAKCEKTKKLPFAPGYYTDCFLFGPDTTTEKTLSVLSNDGWQLNQTQNAIWLADDWFIYQLTRDTYRLELNDRSSTTVQKAGYESDTLWLRLTGKK